MCSRQKEGENIVIALDSLGILDMITDAGERKFVNIYTNCCFCPRPITRVSRGSTQAMRKS